MNHPNPDAVTTKEQFISFLKDLERDFKENNEEWQNITVSDYLESIGAWLEDTKDKQEKSWEKLDWGKVADLFYTGRIYE